MGISEQIAYLRGLAEGIGITADGKEGKFYQELLNCLEDISDAMDMLVEEQDDIAEYVESMDEDLSEVEELLFAEEDDDIDDYDDLFDYDPLVNYVEADCPGCGETIAFFDDAADSDDIICPACDVAIAPLEEKSANDSKDDDIDNDN